MKSIWNENIENSKISGSEFQKSPVTPKPNYEAMLTPGISNICHVDVFINFLGYSKPDKQTLFCFPFNLIVVRCSIFWLVKK